MIRNPAIRYKIYGVLDPDTKEVLYVGYTLDLKKAFEFDLRRARVEPGPYATKVRALLDQGRKPTLMLYALNISLPTAIKGKAFLSQKFLGQQLVLTREEKNAIGVPAIPKTHSDSHPWKKHFVFGAVEKAIDTAR